MRRGKIRVEYELLALPDRYFGGKTDDQAPSNLFALFESDL
jgi:hypothetical protein